MWAAAEEIVWEAHIEVVSLFDLLNIRIIKSEGERLLLRSTSAKKL